MKNYTIIGIVALVIILGVGTIVWFKKDLATIPVQGVACTMEAKLCPDGSYVGRQGPKCEFAACPQSAPTSTTRKPTTVIGSLNQKVFTNGVFITSVQVLEDSRCPVDVQCIQAGTVRLNVKLESGGDSKVVTLAIGQPVVFAKKNIWLVSVAPAHHSQTVIGPTEYRFELMATDVIPAGQGTLDGVMAIGPVCPVERPDLNCKPTLEMFAARKIAIYQTDRKTLVTTIAPDLDGRFLIKLPAKSYYVTLAKPVSGPERVTGLPVTITIKDFQAVHLKIAIDTGIR